MSPDRILRGLSLDHLAFGIWHLGHLHLVVSRQSSSLVVSTLASLRLKPFVDQYFRHFPET